MTTPIAPLQLLQTFRHKLLGVFPRRADALFELIDALLLTLDPRSPVELSLSPAFRRRFSMVYDALQHGQVDPELARQLLAEAEPAEVLPLAGCAVYGVDTTVDLRPDAETLSDRGKVYSTCQKKAVPGHQYSWLGRIVSQAPAWFAPRDVERVATCDTPAVVAARQVLRLAATLVVAGMLNVVVADSGYAKAPFLAAFVGLTSLCVLVRLPCNRVLYGAPPASVINPATGKRAKKGRPPVHGAKFRLKTPSAPEHHVEFPLPKGLGSVCVSAWGQLHFKEGPPLGRHGRAGRVLHTRKPTQVPAPAVALLEWPQFSVAGSSLPDVLGAVWHRALFPLRQTTLGVAVRQVAHAPGV